MPKTVKKVKRDGYWSNIVVPTKFRIGTRKNGTSAHLMSDEVLQAILDNTDKSKWHDNARDVLALRTA